MTITVGCDYGHGRNTFPPSKGIRKNGTDYHEHTFNASVGVKTKAILQAHGLKTVEAQKPLANDVPLTTRTNYYFAQKVDFILSTHANAASPAARGLCAFYWKGNAGGEKAAKLYAKHAASYGYKLYSGGAYGSIQYQNGKSHWSNFHMLREPNKKGIPAILTENGFMTNSEDFKLIFQSPQFIQDVAEIQAKTVLEYFGIPYMSDDSPVKVSKPNEQIGSSVTFKIVKKGDKGSAVKEFQHRLIVHGYSLPKYGADGHFGDEMLTAVMKFQADNQLAADGLIGEKTVKALKANPKPASEAQKPVVKKEPSVQILTGGLNAASVKLITEYFKQKGWWAQVQFTSDGKNPRALSGGLDPEMRAEFEAWLKERRWSYTVIPKK